MMRSARLDQTRFRLRIVDQVRALQMHASRPRIANLENRALVQALLQRSAPLLDVLRRGPHLHSGKAHDRYAQHRRSKVERPDWDIRYTNSDVVLIRALGRVVMLSRDTATMS